MADGVRIANWDTTSHVLALMRNVNLRKGTKPATAAQFHPYRQPKRPSLTQSLLALKPHLQPKQAPPKDTTP